MTAQRKTTRKQTAPGRPGRARAGRVPRYSTVAQELKQAIAAGRYPVGSHLPTEIELCARFGISRHTAREAVRVLMLAGLVKRRKRAGTVVVAKPDEARYTHDVSSLHDLLQYAQDTKLRLVYIGRIALTRGQALEFAATPGEEWVYATGIRHEGNARRPLSVTRLFINPMLKGIERKLRERKAAVYAMIEQEYGVTIARVEQEIRGIALDVDDAGNLGVNPGGPGLRIIRRYYDDRGRLLQVADNVHVAERFTYRMQLHK